MLSINHLFSFVEMFENVTTGMKKKYKNETTTTSTYQRVFIFIIRVKAFILFYFIFFSFHLIFQFIHSTLSTCRNFSSIEPFFSLQKRPLFLTWACLCVSTA